MAKFSIIGKKFTSAEFRQYCKGLKTQPWVSKVVLHNTARPTIGDRPGGILLPNHIENLHTYYEQLGWSGAPHLFVDATGIWVFNPLDRRGTHSPSYNANAWGVEMLGDFSFENPDAGLGLSVVTNTQQAIAALAGVQKWSEVSSRLLLHKEDPRTTHDCPGRLIDKAKFVSAVNKLLAKPFTVVVNGRVLPGAYVDNGVSYAPIRALSEALGFTVEHDPATNTVTITE